MSQSLSKNIPPSTLQVFQLERYPCYRHLLTIETSTVQRFCDGPLREIEGGHAYFQRRFTVNDIAWGRLDQAGAKIVIDNRDSLISNLSYSEYLTGKILTVGILVKAEWNDPWEPVYEPISAEIAEVSGTSHSATILLSGLSGLQRRSLWRQGEKSCRHIYGGRRCTYPGPELNCDRTFATCDARGNGSRFGGWRFALEAGAVIKLSNTGSQQIPGSSSTSEYIPGPPAGDSDYDHEFGFGVGPDGVYDGPIDAPPIPGNAS